MQLWYKKQIRLFTWPTECFPVMHTIDLVDRATEFESKPIFSRPIPGEDSHSPSEIRTHPPVNHIGVRQSMMVCYRPYFSRNGKVGFQLKSLKFCWLTLPDHELKPVFGFVNLTLAQNYKEKLYKDPMLLRTVILIVYLICRNLGGTSPFKPNFILPQVH